MLETGCYVAMCEACADFKPDTPRFTLGDDLLFLFAASVAPPSLKEGLESTALQPPPTLRAQQGLVV